MCQAHSLFTKEITSFKEENETEFTPSPWKSLPEVHGN
jgi:hypothetical protein